MVFHQYETGVRSGTIKPGVGATQPSTAGADKQGGNRGQQQGANRGTQKYQDPLVLRKDCLCPSVMLTMGSRICVFAI